VLLIGRKEWWAEGKGKREKERERERGSISRDEEKA